MRPAGDEIAVAVAGKPAPPPPHEAGWRSPRGDRDRGVAMREDDRAVTSRGGHSGATALTTTLCKAPGIRGHHTAGDLRHTAISIALAYARTLPQA